jgi:hypothetical protein
MMFGKEDKSFRLLSILISRSCSFYKLKNLPDKLNFFVYNSIYD